MPVLESSVFLLIVVFVSNPLWLILTSPNYRLPT